MCQINWKDKRVIFLTLSSVLLFASCATPKYDVSVRYPVAFETAIRSLADALLQEVERKRAQWDFSRKDIVLDPFIDVASGEIVKVSHKIEQVIFQETTRNFEKIRITQITPRNLRGADYVLNGVIDFTDYKALGSEKTEKYYQVSASIVNLKNGEIIANAERWISDKDLDYTPDPIYSDSPTYIKDKTTENRITTAKTPAGQPAQEDYYSTLDTHALLVEAEMLYAQADLKKALQLFKEASTRKDGQTMKTFAGLYEANYKLKDMEAAEEAFGQLLTASVKENNKLNVKFLFDVNSVDFINNVSLRHQYSVWLLQLNKFFKENNYCFHIVGHSSHTGASRYNETLSLARAKKVQELMKEASFPEILERSKATGKGFQENLVGSGTDDARDAIDRRVEFLLVNCGNL
jgi:outer membrane protein OmpA-like peptidoglycan-associated protein